MTVRLFAFTNAGLLKLPSPARLPPVVSLFAAMSGLISVTAAPLCSHYGSVFRLSLKDMERLGLPRKSPVTAVAWQLVLLPDPLVSSWSLILLPRDVQLNDAGAKSHFQVGNSSFQLCK